MHRLFEVDGVEDFDAVAFLQKGVADLQNRGTFGEDVVKIFRGNIFRIFASKIGGFNIIQHQTLHFGIYKTISMGLISFSKWVKTLLRSHHS